MKVRDMMTERPEYLEQEATIREAAERMRDTGRGFTPIAHNEKIVGIVTDRDIAIRAVAEGKSPDEQVGKIASGKVLYCYEDDSPAEVLQSMQDQQVQRLVVLNNPSNKDFVGVISLSDIAAHSQSADLSKRVTNASRLYH
ncbi:CBS domain-containing protein [Gilvimarinus sp. DA14]|uniref:CBS domain-containing protein n=1 Tax=Gilvimarinus sp. DA14 TaxID=2956798 RepID=UPI0020B8DA41|nr:CBS domain-containing protein [Gilvimarinus sp. DA14]UTF61727.1 CBS domain-containing protein [Gilvimarinus sp. DA14]